MIFFILVHLAFEIGAIPNFDTNNVSEIKDYDIVDQFVIETLVVIHPDVYKVPLLPGINHREYILQNIKKAADLFKVNDIGNNIRISVYKIIDQKLEKDETGTSLINFCDWQATHFSLEEHKHFDYAMYFEINNENQNSKANNPGACQLHYKCSSINFVSKIMYNYLHVSIAHETGHYLNAIHDDLEQCDRYNKGVKGQFIMYPRNSIDEMSWSPCSKIYINNLLKSPTVSCLYNKPEIDLLQDIELDAISKFVISRENACFHESKLKSKDRRPKNLHDCKTLYCMDEKGGKYVYENLKKYALNDIECGEKNFKCIDGVCTNISSIKPINGGWTKWIIEKECSLPCGGGVRLIKRYCTNPIPRHGGSYCIGQSTKYEMCNLTPCRQARSRREVTSIDCEEKIPQMKKVDGILCGHDFKGKCLGGYCRKIDCNNVFFGTAVIDMCGNCDGKNASCYFHEKKFTNIFSNNTSGGIIDLVPFYLITKIPKGSASIVIEMNRNDNQFINLALRTNTSMFVPNDIHSQVFPSNFDLAGLDFNYDYNGDKKYQIIRSLLQTGTTSDDIFVYLLDYYNKGAEFVSSSWYNNQSE